MLTLAQSPIADIAYNSWESNKINTAQYKAILPNIDFFVVVSPTVGSIFFK